MDYFRWGTKYLGGKSPGGGAKSRGGGGKIPGGQKTGGQKPGGVGGAQARGAKASSHYVTLLPTSFTMYVLFILACVETEPAHNDTSS